MPLFSFIANYCYFSFTTAPGAPQNLQVTNKNTTSVTVAWREPEDTSKGPIHGYIVEFRVQGLSKNIHC